MLNAQNVASVICQPRASARDVAGILGEIARRQERFFYLCILCTNHNMIAEDYGDGSPNFGLLKICVPKSILKTWQKACEERSALQSNVFSPACMDDDTIFPQQDRHNSYLIRKQNEQPQQS